MIQIYLLHHKIFGALMKKRVLVSWIGHTDLHSMAGSLEGQEQKELLKEINRKEPLASPEHIGPVRTLVEQESFDEIVLLSNYDPKWTERYVEWLGHGVKAVQVKIGPPTDYEGIFRAADKQLAKIRRRKTWKDIDLSFHLSPGSPAMTAIWLLLGKSRYPATFYQTYGGKAWVTDVPFDLTVDFLPEALNAADKHLQYLASQSPAEIEGFEKIAGDSPALRAAVGRAKRAAMRGVSVLLLGESGTGKEMFARAIHNASPRCKKEFIVVNCAAISRDLLESELFGHKQGSFSGAASDRKGAFEAADGGTLFLDEVGECDVELQAKLLRALQPIDDAGPCERRIRRVGEATERKCDVRIIAATNRDLRSAIGEGRFREDLFYRLAVFTVTLPPLRDRKGDIPQLTERLLAQINRQFGQEGTGYQHKSISPSAIEFVQRHFWPGNIRQLQNALIQASVLAMGDLLERADIEAALAEMPQNTRNITDLLDLPLGGEFNLVEHLKDIQRRYLRRAMEEAGGVKSKAALLLGMDNYQTLSDQLRRLDVTGDWS